jgi:uncharacterized protein YciI
MKKLLLFCLFFSSLSAFAQSSLPLFLEGRWQIAGVNRFERWDRLNDESMKGFAYDIVDGKMVISEYLDITSKNGKVTYTATVLHQNDGKPVDFKMTQSDSVLSFENPNHNFPKKIVYKKLSDWEILVELSGGRDKKISFRMLKEGAKALDSTTKNPNYDAALAKRLGADEFGMKSFFLVILKTGPKEISDKTQVSNIFQGHMANIERLAAQKKLIVAGPLGKNEKNYQGIFIFANVRGQDEVKELLQSDPAIKSGLLAPEIYDWYGSAALPEYLDANDKIWKSKH